MGPNRQGSVLHDRWRRLRQALILTGVMFIALGGYLTVLWWRGPSAVIVTQTAWDRALPFYPGWVWVYLFPYLLAPVLGALLSEAAFAWYIRRGLSVVAFSLVVFAILPTKTIRPSQDGLGDGLSARMYRSMVRIDGPAANAAPSLHVSLTCLLGVALIRDHRRFWPLIALVVCIVWLSTLLTQQHHLIDVATGALVGGVFALPFGRGAAAQRAITAGPASGNACVSRSETSTQGLP